MLKIYADETGTHDSAGQLPGSQVAGVAGYLAWKDNWDAFEVEWCAFLDRYGVPDFHMNTYMRARDLPYRQWSDLKRKAFGSGLRQIIHRHTAMGFGGLLIVQDYARVAPAVIREQTKPFQFCFQAFVDLVRVRIETLPGIRPSDQVAFVFDQNQEHAGEALAAYHHIKATRDPNNRLGGALFDTRKKHRPLDSADLMAWVIRDDLTGWKPGGRHSAWGKALATKGDLHVGYYDSENLETLFARMRADGQTPAGQ